MKTRPDAYHHCQFVLGKEFCPCVITAGEKLTILSHLGEDAVFTFT